MKQNNKLERLPLLISGKIDGITFDKWGFIVRTFNIDGRKPYLVYRYENPNNKREYIFHSKSLDELIEYLKEFKYI